MVQRYGTSCAERDDGCFVKFEDYAALEAEVRALREKLETPIAMKIKWSPLESTMIDGWSEEVAEDALKRGKKVTAYYGEKKEHELDAKVQQ